MGKNECETTDTTLMESTVACEAEVLALKLKKQEKMQNTLELIFTAVLTVYFAVSTICMGYVYIQQQKSLTRCYEYMRVHLLQEELFEPQLQSYSFETFDGEKIVLDYTNIIKTYGYPGGVFYGPGLVPEDAEIIAPGKDYAYLEDDRYYYVVDSLRKVITVADKNKKQSVMYYDTGEYHVQGNKE